MFKQNICFEVWGGSSGKYRLRDKDGNPIENSPEDTCDRVSKALSEIETPEKRENWFKSFKSIMGTKFAGGGRIMANAGARDHKKETSPINCTVMRQIPDSLAGIMDVLKDAAITLKSGCGVGYDFSTIRPTGSYVFGAGAATSGVISFMKIFDASCATIMSGGGRRGAQMGCLDVSHPEVEAFITAKRQDGTLRYFNLSVLVTDKFLTAVENDENWDLWFWEKNNNIALSDLDKKEVCLIRKDDIPYNHSNYKYFSFAENHNEVVWGNCSPLNVYAKKVFKTVKAKELFDLIMKSTYDFSEPGFILIDRINHENNLYFCETIRATNPCFSGDTLIAVADGRNAVSIKQLAEEGKDVPVYSIDKEGMVSIKWGRNPRITGYDQKLLRITLDDGSYFDVTPEHKCLLKDGTSILAKNLKSGDSLPRFGKNLEPVKAGGKDYYMINCDTNDFKNGRTFEHRLIAKFYYPEQWENTYNKAKENGFAKTGGLVVHHKDYNQLNNSPNNLQIMTFKEHSKFHGEIDQSGEKNGKYSGVSSEEIKKHGLIFTNKLGRRFSKREWRVYAKENNLPQQFSQFRVNELGTVEQFAKYCASELNIEYSDLDPRIVKTYKSMLSQGYDAKIENNFVYVNKVCESCKETFYIEFDHREQSFCSQKCSNIHVKNNEDIMKKMINGIHQFNIEKMKTIKQNQAKIYSELKFKIGRDPLLKEWEDACKKEKLPRRIGKAMKFGYKNFEELKEAGNNYNHKVVSVKELDGEHIVYNITVDDNHTLAVITGSKEKRDNLSYTGVYVANCGEQPLHPLASCLLGSMILPEYVENAFEKDASFNFKSLFEDVLIASRALDNVVEINNLPLKEMQEEILNKRRHGLGITGLGSALNMLGLKYGSDKSVELAETISFTIARASLIANVALAKEKGCAPIFKNRTNRGLVLESGYMKRLLSKLSESERTEIISDVLEYGLRYSHATSIAPTGTMSLTWGNNCSNGIEPVFANSYLRNIRAPGKKTKIQEEVCDYAYFLWKEKFGDTKLPEYWSTTDSLEVSDHVKIQAAVQRWCDSSISKTINVPQDYSFDKFKNVYLEGWKLGLKGVTTFRFNPDVFSGVLVQKENLENTEYVFTLDDGTEVSLKGSESVEYDGEVHNVANLFDALKEGIYGNM